MDADFLNHFGTFYKLRITYITFFDFHFAQNEKKIYIFIMFLGNILIHTSFIMFLGNIPKGKCA